MKNAKMNNTNGQQTGIFIFNFLLSNLLLLFFFGCHESAKTTGEHLINTPVNNLAAEATQIILAGLADEDPRVRVNAVEVVATTRQIQLMPKVTRLLTDEFVPVRFAAALAVGDTEYHPAERLIRGLLKAPDENTQIAAAYAMSKLGSPDSLGPVRKAIASKDQTIRANAIILLGKSGDKSALDILQWAQQDINSDDKVKLEALEARARLGDEQIFPRLWAIVFSAYADDRVMGIKAMGALGTEKAKNVLITKLDDEVLEVRLAAAEQLGMLGSDSGEPEVLDALTKNLTADLDKQGRERVNVFTSLAIGQIGTEPLKKFLPGLLKDKSKFVRIAAAKAVFQCIKKG